MTSTLVPILLLFGIPALLIALVLVGFSLSGTWPLPLFTAASLLLLVLALAYHARGRGRKPRPLIVTAILLLANVLILPVSYYAVYARGRALFQSEVAYLTVLGRAMALYREDWDDQLPMARGWGNSLGPYVRGWYGRHSQEDASLRPHSNEESFAPALRSLRYRYEPPRAGESADDAVVITVKDWSPEVGVELYLHGSGKLEKHVIWPWWKYLLNGRYPFEDIR